MEADRFTGEELIARFPILQHFRYDHLPELLQSISRPFSILAYDIAGNTPFAGETQVALRKLLEAKDAAVRAAIES